MVSFCGSKRSRRDLQVHLVRLTMDGRSAYEIILRSVLSQTRSKIDEDAVLSCLFARFLFAGGGPEVAVHLFGAVVFTISFVTNG